MSNKTAKPKQSHKFFNNKACKYFPCHDISDTETFNCLFCFCPLYARGDKCGGNFEYNDDGIKSCNNCDRPHKPGNYDLIIDILDDWSHGKC